MSLDKEIILSASDVEVEFAVRGRKLRAIRRISIDLYKNETEDKLSDDELLHLMKEQYENPCHGDLDYLESTCLERVARAVRAGGGLYEG